MMDGDTSPRESIEDEQTYSASNEQQHRYVTRKRTGKFTQTRES